MHALIVREPWIDLILSGRKTWEMRSTGTAVRGLVALVRKGSGTVCGVVEVVDSLPAIQPDGLAATADRHAIPADQFAAVARSRWLCPWVLAHARALPRPVPYDHPSGAVTWVRLGAETAAKVCAQLDAVEHGHGTAPFPAIPAPASSHAAPPPSPAPASDAVSLDHALVEVTAGNLKNNHIYLRSAARLFPDDTIGGGNRHAAGRGALRVSFVPGQTVETDIAGDKMILRNRAAVGDFFRRAGAEPGDTVCIERWGERDYVVQLVGKARPKSHPIHTH